MKEIIAKFFRSEFLFPFLAGLISFDELCHAYSKKNHFLQNAIILDVGTSDNSMSVYVGYTRYSNVISVNFDINNIKFLENFEINLLNDFGNQILKKEISQNVIFEYLLFIENCFFSIKSSKVLDRYVLTIDVVPNIFIPIKKEGVTPPGIIIECLEENKDINCDPLNNELFIDQIALQFIIKNKPLNSFSNLKIENYVIFDFEIIKFNRLEIASLMVLVEKQNVDLLTKLKNSVNQKVKLKGSYFRERGLEAFLATEIIK